jgi:hypothetical protein
MGGREMRLERSMSKEPLMSPIPSDLDEDVETRVRSLEAEAHILRAEVARLRVALRAAHAAVESHRHPESLAARLIGAPATVPPGG